MGSLPGINLPPAVRVSGEQLLSGTPHATRFRSCVNMVGSRSHALIAPRSFSICVANYDLNQGPHYVHKLKSKTFLYYTHTTTPFTHMQPKEIPYPLRSTLQTLAIADESTAETGVLDDANYEEEHHDSKAKSSSSRGLITLPVTFYQILGLEESVSFQEVELTCKELKSLPEDDSYSSAATSGRRAVLDIALAKLAAARKDLTQSGPEPEGLLHLVSIPWKWLPGALCLLVEAGEPHAVLNMGEAALRAPASKNLRHDILLAMALAHCTLASEAFESEDGLFEGFEELVIARDLLISEKTHPASGLVTQIEQHLEAITPKCTLRQLSLPSSSTNDRSRVRALAALRHMLAQGISEDPTCAVKDWDSFLGEALGRLSAAEIVRELPLAELFAAGEDAEGDKVEGLRAVLSAENAYTVAMAHVGVGYVTRRPDLVDAARCMLVYVGTAQDVDLRLEFAICSSLLGLVDEAFDWLESPAPLSPPSSDLFAFKTRDPKGVREKRKQSDVGAPGEAPGTSGGPSATKAEPGEELGHAAGADRDPCEEALELIEAYSARHLEEHGSFVGLCQYAEDWLHQFVLHAFSDLHSKCPSLAGYYGDPEVQQYMEEMAAQARQGEEDPSGVPAAISSLQLGLAGAGRAVLSATQSATRHFSRWGAIDSFLRSQAKPSGSDEATLEESQGLEARLRAAPAAAAPAAASPSSSPLAADAPPVARRASHQRAGGTAGAVEAGASSGTVSAEGLLGGAGGAAAAGGTAGERGSGARSTKGELAEEEEEEEEDEPSSTPAASYVPGVGHAPPGFAVDSASGSGLGSSAQPTEPAAVPTGARFGSRLQGGLDANRPFEEYRSSQQARTDPSQHMAEEPREGTRAPARRSWSSPARILTGVVLTAAMAGAVAFATLMHRRQAARSAPLRAPPAAATRTLAQHQRSYDTADAGRTPVSRSSKPVGAEGQRAQESEEFYRKTSNLAGSAERSPARMEAFSYYYARAGGGSHDLIMDDRKAAAAAEKNEQGEQRFVHMSKKEAEQVVRQWQAAKGAALGQGHAMQCLSNCLDKQALAEWTALAEEAARSGCHWRFVLLALDVTSAKLLKTPGPEGHECVEVEASLEEAAELVDPTKERVSSTYYSSYRAKYKLERRPGQAWKICEGGMQAPF
eukprot:jgi/Mesen1/1437/ME000132S00384